MPPTPLDIHNKEFRRQSIGGYNRNEVDEFLDLIIQEFERNLRQIQEMKEQIQNLENQLEQYRALEDTINRTLVAAQETADDIKNNARKEAELIIQEARLQAEKLVEAGRHKAARILEENADLQRAMDALRVQLRSVLEAQLQALDRHLSAPTPFELVSAGREPLPGGHDRVAPAPPLTQPQPPPAMESGAPLPSWDQEEDDDPPTFR